MSAEDRPFYVPASGDDGVSLQLVLDETIHPESSAGFEPAGLYLGVFSDDNIEFDVLEAQTP